MTNITTVGSIVLKLLKLVLNLIILILYRTGYSGQFLGVGGTWNLNEEKNPDTEIIASGVFVGFFIYTVVSLVSYCFATADHKNTFTDIVMNFLGIFLWLAVGATALHYWEGYQGEHKYTHVSSERQVGLALGALCVISGVAYLLDTVLSVLHFLHVKKKQVKVAISESYYDVPKKIMSADIENNKEEEEKQDNEEVQKTQKWKILSKWPIGFKLLELALAAICLGLIFDPVHIVGMGNTQLHHVGIMYTSYTGCMVIILGFIIGRCLKEKLGYKTSFIFSCANAALFLTTGVLLTADRSELTKDHFFHPSRYLLNMMTASIVLTFVNSGVFVADAIMTFVKQQDF
ncbi:hypothetical protein FQR65_LT13809 [Abscondita terminalis]|nr:hypothetical protein FQR65_LT13809 [Abscondita terminalis]